MTTAERRLIIARGGTMEEACAECGALVGAEGLAAGAVFGRELGALRDAFHDIPFADAWEDDVALAVLDEQARLGPAAGQACIVANAEALLARHDAVRTGRLLQTRPQLDVWVALVHTDADVLRRAADAISFPPLDDRVLHDDACRSDADAAVSAGMDVDVDAAADEPRGRGPWEALASQCVIA
jgi:hypothetical protein